VPRASRSPAGKRSTSRPRGEAAPLQGVPATDAIAKAAESILEVLRSLPREAWDRVLEQARQRAA
jgi:hypothetical protein